VFENFRGASDEGVDYGRLGRQWRSYGASDDPGRLAPVLMDNRMDLTLMGDIKDQVDIVIGDICDGRRCKKPSMITESRTSLI